MTDTSVSTAEHFRRGAWKRAEPHWQALENQNRDRNALDSLDSSLIWSPEVTPPLPMHWPVIETTSICWYVYGRNVGMIQGGKYMIEDGEYITDPLVSVVFDPDYKEWQVRDLSESLQETSIQGIRPLSGLEVSIAKARTQAENVLVALALGRSASLEGLELIRIWYGFWEDIDGIRHKLPTQHQHADFFAWVHPSAQKHFSEFADPFDLILL